MPEPTLSKRAAGLKSSAIRDLLALTEKPGVLSLAGGLPAPETFPAERLAVASTRLLESGGAAALQYTTTEGLPVLREWIAAREAELCGRECSPDDVLVTSGSQQALLLLGLALADPGTAIVVEQPGYLGGLQALRACGAELVAVRCDEYGLDVDALAARLGDGLRPAAVYTVPSFQNPSGALMPAERRAALGALADHYGFVVIDDDPYGDLWFDAPPPPPVRAHTDN
ncbi:MAG TPA: PLP-dependent aminotransferase family protein, partial [Acidimicrobiales bacterium]